MRFGRSFTLTNPYFLAGKAGLACALALATVEFLSIPDRVTASFVAILCCSPGALMGLRTSAEQLGGSVLGGVFGTLAASAHLPPGIGVPLAVAAAIWTCHALAWAQATVAAAFTALFLQIVSFGAPLETFGYRLEAVGIAGASALLVNLVVSSLFYVALFSRRMRKLCGYLRTLLVEASEVGPGEVHRIFAPIGELEGQLRQALKELRFRRQDTAAEEVQRHLDRLLWTRRLAHLVVELAYEEKDAADRAATADFLRWVAAALAEGEAEVAPPAAMPLATMGRIAAHLEACPHRA